MKIFAIVFGVLVLFVGFVIYNVEHEVHAAVATTPGPAEAGKLQLHSQLEQVKQRELQVEKQDWDSSAKLRSLIKFHEHRIAELTGNSAASEILAYDHDSITRLEKRISTLDEQQQAAAAKPDATSEQ